MSRDSLTVLFAGPLLPGSTTLQRLVALRELGHQTLAVDTSNRAPENVVRRLADRAIARAYRLGSPIRPAYRDRSSANEDILRALRQAPWRVLWLDKGISIEAGTLIEAKRIRPGVRILGYSPDDMSARHNHSAQFLEHLPFYDVFFTTKSYNVSELKALGCPDVRFVDNAFDPATHRPVVISNDDRIRFGAPIGFIGTYELERARSMALLRRNGFDTRIFGNGWGGVRVATRFRLRPENKALVGDDYARAICSFDINLHFLRKLNRDLQTTRSIEIPACGRLMLAERTPEHEALFEDRREAVFFGSDDELLAHVRYYLRHPSECTRIGAAARERCLRSGYSNHDRMKKMLASV